MDIMEVKTMNNENDEIVIDLGKYLNICARAFNRFKKYIAAIIILCVAVSVAAVYFTTDLTYSSEAVLVAKEENKTNVFYSEDDENSLNDTISKMMTGPVMRELIMKKLERNTVPAKISTSQVEDTNLIKMTVTSSDKHDAYDVAKCILDNYEDVIKYTINDVSFVVMDEPQIADKPDNPPDYIKGILMGLVAGIVINCGILFLFAFFRNTVLDSEDIKEKIKLDTIASVPSLRFNREMRNLLVSSKDIQYSMRKAFYDLRIVLEHNKMHKGYKVFLFTSAMPGEGKTLCALNSAISLAKGDARTVLVDLDLRKPASGAIFDEGKQKSSIRDYLEGKSSAEEIITHYQQGNIDVIAGGEPTDSAPELLESERLDELLVKLREEYDYVILDLPPMYGIQDALLAGRLADSAVIVVKQDFSKINDILNLTDELGKNVKSIAGVILNQVNATVFDDGYNRKSYKYGYEYGYGYERNSEKYYRE